MVVVALSLAACTWDRRAAVAAAPEAARCPSLGGYVTGTGATSGVPAGGGHPRLGEGRARGRSQAREPHDSLTRGRGALCCVP